MSNSAEPKNPQEALQQMNILFLALLAGQVLIFLALFFTQESGEEITYGMEVKTFMNPIVLLGSMIAISTVTLSFYIYNKRKRDAKDLSGDIMEKLKHYRASLVMRMAFLEGANLVMILLYFFVSPQILFLFYFGLGLILFAQTRPTIDRISQDYQLSGTEQNELRSASV